MYGYLFIYLPFERSCYRKYHPVQHSKLHAPPTVFMGFAFVSEQTGIISLHSSNWLVAITKMVFTTRYEQNL